MPFKGWQCYATTDWGMEIWVVQAEGKKWKYVWEEKFCLLPIS